MHVSELAHHLSNLHADDAERRVREFHTATLRAFENLKGNAHAHAWQQAMAPDRDGTETSLASSVWRYLGDGPNGGNAKDIPMAAGLAVHCRRVVSTAKAFAETGDCEDSEWKSYRRSAWQMALERMVEVLG